MKAQDLHIIYFAGGCFWGVEHYFKQVSGVVETQAGYANGNRARPDYEEVCTGRTGFAETVRVTFDATQVDLDLLLQLYFKAIDPTSLNRQGGDAGSQYRTGIFFTDPQDEAKAQQALDELAKQYADPIVVELLPLKNFYAAEDYHQDYLDKHPDGYCHLRPELFQWAAQANALRTEEDKA
jgi:peptide-methionine (S)-S-oxide reductase